MRVKVTKDTVKIIDDNYILNKGEYNINKCEFEFTEEYTEDLVKKAIFVNGETKKEMAIINNECEIPQEVLNSNSFELRVYAYEVNENELVLRYSPTYTHAYLREGSYMGGATPSEKITPSQFQQYEQALHEGLQDINDELDLVEEKLVETETLNIEGSKEGHTTTITITGRDGSTNSINIYDGEKGDTGEPGPKGEQGVPGTPGEKGDTGYYFTPTVSANGDLSWTNNGGLENPTTVNIKGPKGDVGPKGDTGVQGPQGLQGPKGDIGATGPQGPAGQDGVTPVKGVDYFTSEDIAEIEGDIEEIIGDLQDLDTTDKTDIVSAINEVASNSGGQEGTIIISNAQESHDKTIEFLNRYLEYGSTDILFIRGTSYRRILEIKSQVSTSEASTINIQFTAGAPTTATTNQYYGLSYKTYQAPEVTTFYVKTSEWQNGHINEIYSALDLRYPTNGLYDTGYSAIRLMTEFDSTKLPLGTKNTTAYTPTDDYNPATKKYVDDSIAAAITTTLNGGY